MNMVGIEMNDLYASDIQSLNRQQLTQLLVTRLILNLSQIRCAIKLNPKCIVSQCVQ
jgi:hypothetical protein